MPYTRAASHCCWVAIVAVATTIAAAFTGNFTEDDSTNVATLFPIYPQIECNSGDTSVSSHF